MKYLPIGSVITLKEAKNKLMIIGTAMQVENSDQVYDYIGIPFPEGYIDSETMFLFMHDDIQELNFIGFVNMEMQVYRNELEKELKKNGVIAE